MGGEEEEGERGRGSIGFWGIIGGFGFSGERMNYLKLKKKIEGKGEKKNRGKEKGRKGEVGGK